MPEYQPITSKEIERGYYFLTHRQLFIRLAYGSGVLLLLIIYGSLILNLINLVRQPSWQASASSLSASSSWASIHQAQAPRPLDIGPAQALSVGGNLYNLVAVVKNPNNKWLLPQFQYQFSVNGQVLPAKTSYLNTEDRVMLVVYGYQSNQIIRDLKLEISDYHWYRLNSQVKSVTWEIKQIVFQALNRQQVGEQTITLPANVTWQARNLSLYDFWQVDWQVILFSNDKIAAVTEVPARDVRSLSTQKLEAIFNYNLPTISRVEIWPRVNWLDKNNFKTIESAAVAPGKL